MRCLRTYLQRSGLVSTLLIGGVLGGLTAPLPSEAATLTIDGVDIPLASRDAPVGTGAGNRYTCEAGYSHCWYITPPGTATRDIQGSTGLWKLGNVSSTNRARLRIYDVGGTPETNVDKMNLTGITLTPTTASAKLIHIKINHTYDFNVQKVGNYQWGMGATGHFDPVGTETPLGNKFILTGKGKFKTPTVSDPELVIGKLDLGPVDSSPPLAPGQNGIISQTVASKTVKTACNTLNLGSCKPEITYDYELYVVGTDTLVLTDSLIGAGITCTDAELDPDIPSILRFLMRLVDPTGLLPTKISGLNEWIDDMAERYRLNPRQLAKVEKVKVALAKWLLGQTCAGKVQQVLNIDAASGIAQGLATGGRLMTTSCSDPTTCGTGTIVIRKTVYPDVVENFSFTGTGSGIGDFSIRTDQEECSEGCDNVGSQTFTHLPISAAGGVRTITETSFPPPPAYYSSWALQSVYCDGDYTQWEEIHEDGEGPLVGIRVNYLNDNQTLTCTFHNSASD